MMPGDRFGYWTVLSRSSVRERHWVCECVCGTKREVFAGSLTRGVSRSCGCTNLEVASSITHGHSGSPEWTAWCRMRQRCENPRTPAYADYGGRGIAVCERWRRSFSNFLADVGYRPEPGMSIDRIDVNGNYEPGNVRWATHKQQANNRRSSVFVEFNGERRTIAEWADHIGIRAGILGRRLRSGMSVEKALTPFNLKSEAKGLH